MSDDDLRKIDKNTLPWLYRLVLKIPRINSLENASGVFWSIIVPIFLILEFFLSMFLLLLFPFPTNVILTAIIPIAVFLMFIRVTLERFINFWNSTIEKSSYKWNIEKTMQEHLETLEKKKIKQNR